MRQYIRLHDDDNVVVALDNLQQHHIIETDAEPLQLLDDVPPYFKVAIRDIASGAPVIKYGMCIGTSTETIARGQLVHVHNMCSNYL